MVARLEAEGFKFESDPDFLAHVTDWIDGKIDLRELRAIHTSLIRSRLTLGRVKDRAS
jgi:hypothetical protein